MRGGGGGEGAFNWNNIKLQTDSLEGIKRGLKKKTSSEENVKNYTYVYCMYSVYIVKSVFVFIFIFVISSSFYWDYNKNIANIKLKCLSSNSRTIYYRLKNRKKL